jgi:hypothetical protein
MGNGTSLTLCFGKYAGFYCTFSRWSWRVVIGWFAITLYPTTDLEAFIEQLRDRAKH